MRQTSHLGRVRASMSRWQMIGLRFVVNLSSLGAAFNGGFPNIRILASVEAVNILIEEEQLSAAANTLDCFSKYCRRSFYPKNLEMTYSMFLICFPVVLL